MQRLGLKNTAALLLLVSAVACDGAQGPQGPAGPPADRSKLYCLSSGATLNATKSLTTSIVCNAKTDIPWQGACEAPDLPSGVYLARSEPVNWSNLSEFPGWTCTWAVFDVAPNLNFGANAEICCFAMGQ
jgi:hypothetical protein